MFLETALGLVLAFAVPAQVQSPRPQFRPGEIIVRFQASVDAAGKQSVLASHGLQVERSSPGIRCDLVRAEVGNIELIIASLRQDPRIEHAQPNYVYTAFSSPPQIWPQDPFLNPADPSHTYGPMLTKLPSLWRSSSGGAGVTIAILDTGVDFTHPEFTGRLLPGYDFVNQDANPSDDNGHGTHVTGISAAAMNGLGCVGTAPLATVLPVKILAGNGSGTTMWTAEGLDYAASNGAQVINLSLGASVDDCLVREAVARAYAAGCTIVAASGNGGGAPIAYPAGDEEVISVGAVDSNGVVTAYSQYGPTLDVVAPGHAIYSSWPGGGYAVDSGTSMAAPFVSGICALLRADFAGIRSWEIETFLREHTRNTDAFNPPQGGNHDGYGLVSFGSLKDYSNGTEVAAWSDNISHEWLGADVTGESSINDNLAVGVDDDDDYLPDLDGATNQSGEDGADDGVFPASHPRLPFLPPHIAAGAQSLDVDLSVGNRTGPRYSTGQQVRAQVWMDFDSEDGFEAEEQMVNSNSGPAGWAANTFRLTVPITPPENHYRGDPLRVRSRLDYVPGGAAPGATGAQVYGEVEDQLVVNFVEDFDAPDFHPGIYASYDAFEGFPSNGGWSHMLDGTLPYPPHHNVWRYMETIDICGGGVDMLLRLPEDGAPIDLREVTNARLRLWVAHGTCALGCPGMVDNCRISLRRYDTIAGPFTEFTLFTLPGPALTDCGGPGPFAADLDLDLAAYCGYFVQIVVHHTTSGIDHLAIDDVVVFGYDARAPQSATLAAMTGPTRISATTWNHPNENNPVVPGTGIISQGSLYALRLALAGGAFDWANAFRLTPRDFANASSSFPAVGAAGSPAAASVRIPTTFPNLAIAIREGDEVENLGTPSPTTLSVNPAFFVDVLPPGGPINVTAGQILDLDFVVTNSSSALDALTIDVSDSQTPDWIACPFERTRVLLPLAGATERVRVGVPSTATAGTSDTVTMTATSLSDSSVLDIGSVVLNVVGGPTCIGTQFCSGDGTSGPCPCENTGTSGRGCNNSEMTGGSQLCITGNPSLSNDTVVLNVSGERATAFSLFLQGKLGIAAVNYGDGRRCIGGVMKRLYSRNAVGGNVFAPMGAELSVSARSAFLGDTIPSMGTRYYQVSYRDPVPDFCPNPPGSTFNVSNAVSLVWGP